MKLNSGILPKNGGPKEPLSQNDLDNQELYEWAKHEKMDLNEINRQIYNQRNRKNTKNNKEQDEKKLKEFVDLKNDSKNSNNSNNSNNSQSSKNSKNLYKLISQENTSLKIESLEINNKSSENNLNRNPNTKEEQYEATDLNELDELDSEETRESLNYKKDHKYLKNSENELNQNSSIRNKNLEKYDSIGRAKPINLSKEKAEDFPLLRCTPVLKFEDNPNIFVNKKNSSTDTDNHNFLNKEVDFSKKIKEKRIASISNRIINANDANSNKKFVNENYNTENPFEYEAAKTERNISSKSINNNNNKKIDQIQNSIYAKKIIDNKASFARSSAKTTNNNLQKSNTERIHRDSPPYRKSTKSIQNSNQKAADSKINNSLYDHNPNSKLYYAANQNTQINDKSRVENPAKKYEDINSFHDYANALKAENFNLHSFNNLKGDVNSRNQGLTPDPKQINLNAINNSVAISNDYKQRFSDYYGNLSPEKNRNIINTQNINQEMNQHVYNYNNANVNQNHRISNDNNQNQQQYRIPPEYKEIPCVLGTGYQFNYEKYINSGNQSAKKTTTEFIKKLQNQKGQNTENDIDRMLQDLKNPIITNQQAKPLGTINSEININNNNDNFNNKENDLKRKESNRELEKSKSPFKSGGDISLEKKNLESEIKDDFILSEQKSQNLSSAENQKKTFSNLETEMLKSFDIKNYNDLPNFEIPLEYNTPEKKSKIKKYFLDTVRSSRYDIKEKDDVNSAIKKLELILYYFTNMKDR